MTRCQDQAKHILTAWTSGNDVGTSGVYWPSADLTADEQERAELLEGIRMGLSANGRSEAEAPVVAVSLRLLRHLAAVN